MKGAAAVAAAAVVGATFAMSLIMFGDDAPAGAAVPSGGAGTLNVAAVPQAYAAALAGASTRCAGVSGPVLAAQLQVESGWNPAASSVAGAQGIAQFMPATWATWGADHSGDGVANASDPVDAIGSQADFMCHLRAQVDAQLAAGSVTGDPLQLTLAAYNAGPANVTKAAGIPAFTETHLYIGRILAAIPTYTTTPVATGATTGAGGGPAISADGTYRKPASGSGHLDISNLCHITWAGPTQVLRCDAEQGLAALNGAFKAQFGTDLTISSAYRDYATQIVLKATKGPLAATPGESNHGWGLAVDLSGIGPEGSTQHTWLRANAPTYGWTHPTWARTGGANPEAWHWEFTANPQP